MTAGTHLQGYDPRTGRPTGDPVPVSDAGDVGQAVDAAREASAAWAGQPGTRRAEVLDAVADALDARTAELVAVAEAETALGEARLTGEVARTSGQLRAFAGVLRDGRYLGAVLSPADRARNRPDVRRMLYPVGPVAVFSASNFPFAFSVVGGDTASALAAGCPVVVKAHEAQPGTSQAVATTVRTALRAAGAPDGLLGLVHGRDAGTALVQHPAVRAVGFTGSPGGGRALFDLAQGRPEPVPFYGELGSVNPVVVLPGVAARRPGELAQGYAASLTLGSGQFCTNPGLLFVPQEAAPLLEEIGTQVTRSTGGPLLSGRIRDAYRARTQAPPPEAAPLATGSADDTAWSVPPTVWRCTAAELAASPGELTEEVFGPAGLVVTYASEDELAAALTRLPGSLTGTVHAAGDEQEAAGRIGALLRPRVGRLIHNGWPTGVAVCWAMHHGGPWPATTASAHTSVGATAINRWLVPTAYQDWPDALLPPELRDANPLGIPRTVEP
ncbi:aldehyde dehydrogenase (NADP(+)) [Streptomyces sp. TRM 70351]|uniref:aldehyde dehydrogenase (NADP(+)) n=1 Tax=Streptomyces sp. TRM 70351 TaxID=3116552 RepID=UPI002E7B7C73|nr:aldehyde dehydrogenase (NADP(+)) [Streptomyces sp. TRM 70351]MEE1930781.1 aldehyde dehydrogenase (NADP(+)) [Streptomyces sp. TRM 70351]